MYAKVRSEERPALDLMESRGPPCPVCGLDDGQAIDLVSRTLDVGTTVNDQAHGSRAASAHAPRESSSQAAACVGVNMGCSPASACAAVMVRSGGAIGVISMCTDCPHENRIDPDHTQQVLLLEQTGR